MRRISSSLLAACARRSTSRTERPRREASCASVRCLRASFTATSARAAPAESLVHSHLETLEKNGYIRRDPTKPRAIEIIDDDFNLSRREIRNIPLLGHVAAGAPLFAEQNIENYFPMLADQLPAGNLFMLDVRGESMINVGIYDGDKIIVQQTPTAKDGDIVVALIDDSATVKTYYKESGRYRLQPENDSMEPIYVNEVIILGKVIGLYRFF